MFCPTNDYNKDDFLYSNMMNEVRDVREIMNTDKEEPKEKEMLDKGKKCSNDSCINKV